MIMDASMTESTTLLNAQLSFLVSTHDLRYHEVVGQLTFD